MSYVVLVKPPDDHPGSIRVYGAFRSYGAAAHLCARVREEVDAKTDGLDETEGYAYVAEVRPARIREAIRYALTGAS